MPLPVQTYDQIVAAQIAAAQANNPNPFNTSPGSVILALINSNAGNSLWLQALATTLLAITRLSTSSGIDVDTFIQDFGFSRYQGNPASGSVTFSRATDTVPGKVPVGILISDSSTNLNFIITVDSTNPHYVPGDNAYEINSGTPTLIVPATCVVNGVIGNVGIGQIDTILNQSLTPGFDTVSNAGAFTNGADPWSDTLTKQNFLLYIQSLSRATYQAIAFIVSTTTNGSEVVKRYNIVENYNEAGNPQLGYFYVVIDNGTGSSASTTLKNLVSDAVNNYRGLTIQYNIDKATFIAITITVSVKLVAQPTETQAQITVNITNALQAYAASIPFNQYFLYSKISEIVYDSDPNILSIPSTAPPVLNGSNIDIAGNNLQVFGIPSVSVVYL